MRVEFVSRGVVCLAAMPPASLDLAAFEGATQLGRPLTQVVNPQVAVADYGRIRILVVLGQPSNQVQLEAPGNVNRDLCRRAATELLRQATPYGLRGVGFNGFARVECDEGEDPIHALLNEELISSRLGTTVTRAGAKLVYPMDEATATLDISPAPEDDTLWSASINRHYPAPPDQEEQARAISWFAALNDELVNTVRHLTIIRPAADTEDVA